MHPAFAALIHAAATPSPTPSIPTIDPELVTPGPWGFVAIGFLALAVVLLVGDMMRRIRRARIRSEVDEQLDAEEAAARAAETEEPPSAAGEEDPDRSP